MKNRYYEPEQPNTLSIDNHPLLGPYRERGSDGDKREEGASQLNFDLIHDSVELLPRLLLQLGQGTTSKVHVERLRELRYQSCALIWNPTVSRSMWLDGEGEEGLELDEASLVEKAFLCLFLGGVSEGREREVL